jgi:phosphate transport system substrate-binding protein
VPTIAATTLASNVSIPADTKVSVTNTDNAAGYPIASFTWALIYKEQNYNGRTKDQATKLVKLLWWNIHDGQKFCAALNYAPLSKAAVKAAEAVLKSATYGGKAIL